MRICGRKQGRQADFTQYWSTSKHGNVCVGMRMFLCTLTCMCVCTCIRSHVHTFERNMLTCACVRSLHAHTQTHLRPRTHERTHAHTQTHTYRNTHARAHTHTHTHREWVESHSARRRECGQAGILSTWCTLRIQARHPTGNSARESAGIALQFCWHNKHVKESEEDDQGHREPQHILG